MLLVMEILIFKFCLHDFHYLLIHFSSSSPYRRCLGIPRFENRKFRKFIVHRLLASWWYWFASGSFAAVKSSLWYVGIHIWICVWNDRSFEYYLSDKYINFLSIHPWQLSSSNYFLSCLYVGDSHNLPLGWNCRLTRSRYRYHRWSLNGFYILVGGRCSMDYY